MSLRGEAVVIHLSLDNQRTDKVLVGVGVGPPVAGRRHLEPHATDGDALAGEAVVELVELLRSGLVAQWLGCHINLGTNTGRVRILDVGD